MNGRYCDNCESHLNDEDYVSYGSWSYTCPNCDFSYRHGSAGVGEQVAKFNSRLTKRVPDLGQTWSLKVKMTFAQQHKEQNEVNNRCTSAKT
jgi:hypothetical protein